MSVVSEKLNRIESATNTIRTKVGASEANTIEEVADMVKDIPIFYFDGDNASEENKNMLDEICELYDNNNPFILIKKFINIKRVEICIINKKDSDVYYFRSFEIEVGKSTNYGVLYDRITEHILAYNKKTRYITDNISTHNTINRDNVLIAKDNTTEWTPSTDYGLVHKKYVDDIVGNINNVLNTLVTVSEE